MSAIHLDTTEDEVLAFLRAKAVQLGEPDVRFTVFDNGISKFHEDRLWIIGNHPDAVPGVVISGKTFEETAKAVRAHVMTPDKRAEKLREEARALLAKADALDPKPKVAP